MGLIILAALGLGAVGAVIDSFSASRPDPMSGCECPSCRTTYLHGGRVYHPSWTWHPCPHCGTALVPVGQFFRG